MLSKNQIVDAAYSILRDYGLADLSMRRLARDLGVQPGALYWHVASKQELLGVLAERILAPLVPVESEPEGSLGSIKLDVENQVRTVAQDFRAALLQVRDGADVVSLAQALNTEPIIAVQRVSEILQTSGLNTQESLWSARVMSHYILGAVAEEQTQKDLIAAGLLEKPASPTAAQDAFTFGVETILRGLLNS